MKSTGSLLCLGLAALLAACSGDDTHHDDIDDDAAALAGTLPYRGVSLAGAEFAADSSGNGALPGVFAVDYIYPDPLYAAGYLSADHFLAEGVTTFRLPFRWERLQPARHAPFDAAELARLTTTVGHLTAKGATVVIDPHNYARYGTALIGSSAVPNSDFADLWSRLASAFKGDARVIFGLMNEPHDMPTEQWASAANAAIAAIRQVGAGNLVLVPGNGWDGAAGWSQSWYGSANATAMLTIQNPQNHFAFEVHQYLDANSAGVSPTCTSATAGSLAMQGCTSWLRANGKTAFLGEFGASSDPTCVAAIDDLLKHVEANRDVYLGWTYWAAGPWWGNDWMAIEPRGGVDVPQMKALLPHLSASFAALPTCSDGMQDGSETGVDCGGSCPACPSASCQPTSYDAASMAHSLGSAMTGGWNLWSNGYVSTSHTFAGGQTTITVTAGGSSAAGVWPHMVVSVDGATIGSVSLGGAGWADYAFPVTIAAGAHEIRVTFDNDYCSTTEDRNLYVAKVAVSCAAGAPAPTCSDGIKNGNETGVDCGGSCPACPSPACQPATYDVASMVHSLGTAMTGGWNLWSNGYVSTNNNFSSGQTTITVTASGSSAAGGWPHMVVSVGGVAVGSVSVQSAAWTGYPFTFTASAGTQEIRVAFDNDYCTKTEGRNLYVQSVAVSCAGTGPSSPPTGSAIRVMPLGDSITLGVNGGYRDGLYDGLIAAGKSVDYVGTQYDPYANAPDKDHEGHPGFTIGNIAASADGWLGSSTPSYVLLMIGTNDVAWWCAQTGSEVADQNASLIDQILADLPGAWVVVASIPPLSSSVIQPNSVDRAQLGIDYNAALQQRVQARIAAGKRVRFADVYSVLSVGDLYDGVHPTEAAADKVAQVWFDALAPILP